MLPFKRLVRRPIGNCLPTLVVKEELDSCGCNLSERSAARAQVTISDHAGQKPLLVRYQAGEGEAPEGPMASLLGSPTRSTSPRIGGGVVTLLGSSAGLQGSPPRSLTSPPGSSGLITPQRAQVRHAGLSAQLSGRP